MSRPGAPRPEIARFLADVAAENPPPVSEVGAAQARLNMSQAATDWWGDRAATAVEASTTVTDAVVPAGGHDIPVRIYRPATPARGAVAYFHGGGWVVGDLRTHDQFCRALATEAAAVLVAVDYRLAPEHPFPAAVDDCLAATRWLRDEAEHLGVDQDRLVIAGDSAGANLAAVVAQQLAGGDLDLAGQVLVYPMTDLSVDVDTLPNAEGYHLTAPDIAWFVAQYASPERRRDPRCSPARAADLTGLPPAYVVTCELDPLHDDGAAYADRLAAAGIRVTRYDAEGMIHGFALMRAITPAADDLRAAIATWLRSLLD